MIKKIIIGAAAFLVIIIVIVAIQDQSSSPSPPPVSPSSTTESTTGEQSTGTTDSISPAEHDYLLTLGNNSATVGPVFTELSNLMANPQIGNDQWTLQVAAQLVTIRLAYEEIIALAPPSSLTNIHLKYSQAMSHFNTATYLIAEGIDALDANLLNQATAEMELGNQLINEATSLVNEFNAAHGV